MIIILGDFNAHILVDPGLPEHIGQNIFANSRPLGHYSEMVLENRDLFLDFLTHHDLVALNTLIPGTAKDQITYRQPGQQTFGPPWDENHFAQMDYILTKKRWKNHFADIRPRWDLDFDSDHLPITAKININWSFGNPVKPKKPKKHNRQTTTEQGREYNADIQDTLLQWETLGTDINDIAARTRGVRPPEIRKPYLKEDTIQLLEQRDRAIRTGNIDLGKILTAQFRRQVQKDRKEHITAQLRTFMRHQQNWPAIKGLRKTFVPRFSKRGESRASFPAQFPNDCARYFATEHWKPQPIQISAAPPPLHPEAMEHGLFTTDEINIAIDSLKPNKASGPDETIGELFRDLDAANRERLLHLYNSIYEEEKIPDHFNEALVVQIYKQGKPPELYSSYRPIALLNVTYKIFAKLLQTRLRETLDDRIVDFQYGYRKGRSTAEPIFIARRVQELAERHGIPLYLLALDYTKAFDWIPHPKLIECLQRMGAPRKLIALVDAIYRDPRFRIKIQEGISEEFRQEIGIRQGCPLFPLSVLLSLPPASGLIYSKT